MGPAGKLLPDGTVQEAVTTPAQIRMAALLARVRAKQGSPATNSDAAAHSQPPKKKKKIYIAIDIYSLDA